MSFRSSAFCFWRISCFLLIIATLVFFLFDILKNAFTYNIQINAVILTALFSGILFVYHRLFLFSKEYRALSQFDSLTQKDIDGLRFIKPIAIYIGKKNRLLSQAKFQTIMASIEKKIDDYSQFPKYISGVLIFLGLLGTFWGLSHTIGNVANIIDNLGIDQSDAAESFLKLKNSLKIPLAGMGIAFGCSLFGLSGSLILGFLNINQKKVSDDFLNKIEEWLTKRTISFDSVENKMEFHGTTFSMGLLEKTLEAIYAFQSQLSDLDGNRMALYNMQKEMSTKISKLTEALLTHQDMIKVLGKNQLELQAVTVSLSQKVAEGFSKEMLTKLSSIESLLGSVVQESISGKQKIVDSLGNDIRMISKTLSAMMRE